MAYATPGPYIVALPIVIFGLFIIVTIMRLLLQILLPDSIK